YTVNDIYNLSESSSTFEIDGERFTIPVAGLYNIYNALAAYSMAKEYGIENEIIKAAFLEIKSVFGRQEIVSFKNQIATLNVVKNADGVNQDLSLIAKYETPLMLVALLNNRHAAGVDVRWLKDGNFESLVDHDMTEIKTGGISAEVMTTRLIEAGFN